MEALRLLAEARARTATPPVTGVTAPVGIDGYLRATASTIPCRWATARWMSGYLYRPARDSAASCPCARLRRGNLGSDATLRPGVEDGATLTPHE